MLKPDQKLAIHFFEQIDKLNGKMGHAVLRYSRNPVACAIDFNHSGSSTRDLVDFGPNVPVVASVDEAVAAGGEVLFWAWHLQEVASPRRWSQKSIRL